MADKCINYKFCNGIAIIEQECLLCGTWYSHGEGWGKLEFIETNEECIICCKKGTQMKFPTNCGNSFCIQCCRNLLYWQEDRYDIDPIKYGCPPCVHDKSCKKRPCSEEDQIIIDNWEANNYDNFIRWNYDEFNLINQEEPYLITKKCPLCRKVYKL